MRWSSLVRFGCVAWFTFSCAGAPSVPVGPSAPCPTAPASAVVSSEPSLTTHKGTIKLFRGLPASANDSAALYDELDYQRASQAYLWALPFVSFAKWQEQHETVFGARGTDLVVYETFKDKLGILTPNATTPYIMTFPDLAKSGPFVIEYPAGPTAGGVGDFWQRPLVDMGETGPDQGKGAKYLLLGPGQTVKDTKGFIVVQSPTFNVMFGTRVLAPEPHVAKEILAKFKLYPLAQGPSTTPPRLIRVEGKTWSQVQPRRLDFWKLLHTTIEKEPVEARDRMLWAMLAPLGLEKGKPFTPSSRQAVILEEGARVGEIMAANFAFNKRFEGARYRSDASWDYVLTFDPSQEEPNYSQLDRRSAWFFEAVTSSKGMTMRKAGLGQAYLGAYHDKTGAWLDGSKNYQLHVPPNPPAKNFWSVTLYDAQNRTLIDNPHQIADRSSRQDLVKNADGSVDLYFGEKPPAGREKNWIPTAPGKNFFAYFRLYGPLEPYLDASWSLPDIELIP
ncbi:MAG TPA: DUF1254 domain-containing protein [Polyangiaceae bacterium]|nr:DUF1254 domain-containing protein [Polyangiaceae bacterium]